LLAEGGFVVMKRLPVFIPLAMLAMVSACASAPKPPSPADLLPGTWNCVAAQGDITTEADVTYLPGGTAGVKAKVSLQFSGQAAEILGAGDATWTFLPDGRLEEMLKSLKVSSAQVAGKQIPTALIQPMVDKQMVNQTSTSTVDISPKSLVLVGDDGVTTTCTR
jgi:hypothetical protein